MLYFLFSNPAIAALKTGSTAPDFALADQTGTSISLMSIIGEGNVQRRGVILSFFASWCQPCREELPLLNSVADELDKKGVKAIIIGVKEDYARIRALLLELKVEKPIVLSDGHGKVTEMYQVRFLPTTFFIGRDGTVKDIIFGAIKNETELRSSMEKLEK